MSTLVNQINRYRQGTSHRNLVVATLIVIAAMVALLASPSFAIGQEQTVPAPPVIAEITKTVQGWHGEAQIELRWQQEEADPPVEVFILYQRTDNSNSGWNTVDRQTTAIDPLHAGLLYVRNVPVVDGYYTYIKTLRPTIGTPTWIEYRMAAFAFGHGDRTSGLSNVVRTESPLWPVPAAPVVVADNRARTLGWPGEAKVQLRWQVPDAPDNLPENWGVTKYQVHSRPSASDVDWDTPSDTHLVAEIAAGESEIVDGYHVYTHTLPRSVRLGNQIGYRVTAVNPNGESEWGDPIYVNAVVYPTPLAPSYGPGDVSSTPGWPGESSRTVQFRWRKTGHSPQWGIDNWGIINYLIYRRASDFHLGWDTFRGTFQRYHPAIEDLQLVDGHYVFTEVLPDEKTYEYRVASLNRTGQSDWGDVVSVTPVVWPVSAAPVVADNPLRIVGFPGQGKIRLQWQVPEATEGVPDNWGITSFRLYRRDSTTTENWDAPRDTLLVAEIPIGEAETVDGYYVHTDTLHDAVESGHWVRYRVTAVNPAGESEWGEPTHINAIVLPKPSALIFDNSADVVERAGWAGEAGSQLRWRVPAVPTAAYPEHYGITHFTLFRRATGSEAGWDGPRETHKLVDIPIEDLEIVDGYFGYTDLFPAGEEHAYGNRYEYRIDATNPSGQSPMTDVVTMTSLLWPVSAAPVVADNPLRIVGFPGQGKIRLQWQVPEATEGVPDNWGITSFRFYRRDSTTTENWDAPRDTLLVAEIPIGEAETVDGYYVHTDTLHDAVESGHWVRYRVTAVNPAGESEWGEPTHINAILLPKPSALIFDISADVVERTGWPGEAGSQLRWRVPAVPTAAYPEHYGITHFTLFRRATGSEAGWDGPRETHKLVDIPIEDLEIVDGYFGYTDLFPAGEEHAYGNRYEYRIDATNPSGQSPMTDVVALTSRIWPVPAVPGNANITATGNKLTLSWTAPVAASSGIAVFPADSGITHYHILRRESESQPYVVFHDSLAPTLEWQFTLPPEDEGTPYHYAVVAVNPAGEGQPSESVEYTLYTVPAPPTRMESLVMIAWQAPSGTVTGYRINRRAKGNAAFGVLVADTGNTDTVYVDTSALVNVPYEYTVQAKNQAGLSTPSSVMPGKHLLNNRPNMVGPLDLGLVLDDSGAVTGVRIEWDAHQVDLTITGYRILRRALYWDKTLHPDRPPISLSAVPFTVLVADTGNTDTTYVDTDVISDNNKWNYIYRAVALGPEGNSDPQRGYSLINIP